MSLTNIRNIRAQLRKERIREGKKANWVKWFGKVLSRKNIAADTQICAYGQRHIVSNPQKKGNVWLFMSKACSGCEAGSRVIVEYQHSKKIADGAPHCALLYNVLLSTEQVKDGEVISLPKLS